MNVRDLIEELFDLNPEQRIEVEGMDGETFTIASVRECSWNDESTGLPVVLVVTETP